MMCYIFFAPKPLVCPFGIKKKQNKIKKNLKEDKSVLAHESLEMMKFSLHHEQDSMDTVSLTPK